MNPLKALAYAEVLMVIDRRLSLMRDLASPVPGVDREMNAVASTWFNAKINELSVLRDVISTMARDETPRKEFFRRIER